MSSGTLTLISFNTISTGPSPPHILHEENSALKVGAGEIVGAGDDVGVAVGLGFGWQPHRGLSCADKQSSGLQNPASQIPSTESHVMVCASPVGDSSDESDSAVSGLINISLSAQISQIG
jgi:hypothetical protein